MSWSIHEAIRWYKAQGAPGDQNALLSLLKEVQAESGGSIPPAVLEPVSRELGVKVSYLVAIIQRFPSLRMGGAHSLELCAGINCGKHKNLAEAAEKLRSAGVSVKFVPCMRLCGKGPNIHWNGQVYHGATAKLLEQLVRSGKSDR